MSHFLRLKIIKPARCPIILLYHNEKNIKKYSILAVKSFISCTIFTKGFVGTKLIKCIKLKSAKHHSTNCSKQHPCHDRLRTLRSQYRYLICGAVLWHVFSTAQPVNFDRFCTLCLWEQCCPVATGCGEARPWKALCLSPGVCALNGKICCIGGWNGKFGSRKCEIYDPLTNQWSPMASLNVGKLG